MQPGKKKCLPFKMQAMSLNADPEKSTPSPLPLSKPSPTVAPLCRPRDAIPLVPGIRRRSRLHGLIVNRPVY